MPETQLPGLGNSTSKNRADNGLNRAWNAYAQDDKEQWVRSTKARSDWLEVVRMEEAQYQRAHK
jgi:hypothetical protein